jgi:hypothetical protein|tara:strand:- start:403 stop:741 length:339 start_codon:yes stop_codon:yes gene_type:complete
MPIHKKDRTFQNIVRDVDIDEIPLDYIERLILILDNGDRVIFDGDDLEEIDEPNIVLFIMSAVDDLARDYGSPVNDIEIVIDYTRLEQEVKRLTTNLLDKDSDDADKGDTSL